MISSWIFSSWSIPSWFFGKWLALIFGGFACGFINTLAGGGSLITLPLLIFLGIDPIVANATNRAALAVQYATSAVGFWTSGVRPALRTILLLSIPGFLGIYLGALLALRISPENFRKVLGIFLLIAIIPIFFRAKDWLSSERLSEPNFKLWQMLIAFFALGVYSGFLQLGVGIWTLFVLLGLGGYGVNQANAVKALILFLYVSLATIMFIWDGKVLFFVSGVLAIGNVGGAWFATRIAQKGSMPWLRWVLLFSVIAASIRLLLF